jgi:hypothetical protein
MITLKMPLLVPSHLHLRRSIIRRPHEKLDVSQSAAAQAQNAAKGTVDVDENQEVTSWKSPNLKYRQPLKPASPDSVVFHLQRKALKYIVISCAVCYLFGKFNLGWVAGLLGVLGGKFCARSSIVESTVTLS